MVFKHEQYSWRIFTVCWLTGFTRYICSILSLNPRERKKNDWTVFFFNTARPQQGAGVYPLKRNFLHISFLLQTVSVKMDAPGERKKPKQDKYNTLGIFLRGMGSFSIRLIKDWRGILWIMEPHRSRMTWKGTEWERHRERERTRENVIAR